MNLTEITNRISKIKKESNPISEKQIYYKGELRTEKIYEVDVSLLRFNIFNGRIASDVSEYTQISGDNLENLEVEDANELVSKWIWEKTKLQNQTTLEDILKKGQVEPGVITKDGVIVDGNRRFMLVRRLNQHHGISKKFKAIILDESYEDGKDVVLDIKRLETTIQLGQDEKVDYEPIQKYLKVKDFVENYIEVASPTLTYEEVKKMMNLKNEKKVKEVYEISKLMDDYLKMMDYQNIYSRLENTEDLFIRLNSVLVTLKEQRGRVGWDYTDVDIIDYRDLGFYLIRWAYNNDEVDKKKWDPKSIRSLYFTVGKQNSIFGSRKIWEDFKTKLPFQKLEDVAQLPSLSKLSTIDKLTIQDAAKKVDKIWVKETSSYFKEALGRASSQIEDKAASAKPSELIYDSLQKLEVLLDEDLFESEGKIVFKDRSIASLLENNPEKALEIVDKIRKISESLKRELC